MAALLAAAAGVTVLATSRRPLHLPGEHELPVPPLDVPRDADVAAVRGQWRGAAVRAAGRHGPAGFRRRPRATPPTSPPSAGRLDGLPLAIELAASRVRLLAPKALLARLDQSLGLAAADAGRPLRQQTMRNLVAWSYDLLAPEAAEAFRRMSVFAGGCDLDALAAVAAAGDGPAAAADPLQLAADLMDVSLITVTEGAGDEPRAGMLETIRQYALEQLELAGDLDDTCRAHAQHYAGRRRAGRRAAARLRPGAPRCPGPAGSRAR